MAAETPQSKDADCTICHALCTPSDLSRAACLALHPVCTFCMAEWLWNHTMCPVCRTTVVPEPPPVWVHQSFKVPVWYYEWFLPLYRDQLGLADQLGEWWDFVHPQQYWIIQADHFILQSKTARAYINHMLGHKR